MVYNVHPAPVDFDNLSRVRTHRSHEADTFDYSRVVVNKPWGYEYLWYDNGYVAAWILYIKQNVGTSLHCHQFKRTSLVVLSGHAVCSTLDERFRLKVMDAVVLEPNVFHTTQAISSDGIFLLEVESPSMKGDLLRLKDNFGRQGQGYESTKQYSSDFAGYKYTPWSSATNGVVRFGSIEMRLVDSMQSMGRENAVTLVVPTRGAIAAGTRPLAKIGEAVTAERLARHSEARLEAGGQLLTLSLLNHDQSQ